MIRRLIDPNNVNGDMDDDESLVASSIYDNTAKFFSQNATIYSNGHNSNNNNNNNNNTNNLNTRTWLSDTNLASISNSRTEQQQHDDDDDEDEDEQSSLVDNTEHLEIRYRDRRISNDNDNDTDNNNNVSLYADHQDAASGEDVDDVDEEEEEEEEHDGDGDDQRAVNGNFIADEYEAHGRHRTYDEYNELKKMYTIAFNKTTTDEEDHRASAHRHRYYSKRHSDDSLLREDATATTTTSVSPPPATAAAAAAASSTTNMDSLAALNDRMASSSGGDDDDDDNVNEIENESIMNWSMKFSEQAHGKGQVRSESRSPLPVLRRYAIKAASTASASTFRTMDDADDDDDDMETSPAMTNGGGAGVDVTGSAIQRSKTCWGKLKHSKYASTKNNDDDDHKHDLDVHARRYMSTSSVKQQQQQQQQQHNNTNNDKHLINWSSLRSKNSSAVNSSSSFAAQQQQHQQQQQQQQTRYQLQLPPRPMSFSSMNELTRRSQHKQEKAEEEEEEEEEKTLVSIVERAPAPSYHPTIVCMIVGSKDQLKDRHELIKATKAAIAAANAKTESTFCLASTTTTTTRKAPVAAASTAAAIFKKASLPDLTFLKEYADDVYRSPVNNDSPQQADSSNKTSSNNNNNGSGCDLLKRKTLKSIKRYRQTKLNSDQQGQSVTDTLNTSSSIYSNHTRFTSSSSSNSSSIGLGQRKESKSNAAAQGDEEEEQQQQQDDEENDDDDEQPQPSLSKQPLKKKPSSNSSNHTLTSVSRDFECSPLTPQPPPLPLVKTNAPAYSSLSILSSSNQSNQKQSKRQQRRMTAAHIGTTLVDAKTTTTTTTTHSMFIASVGYLFSCDSSAAARYSYYQSLDETRRARIYTELIAECQQDKKKRELIDSLKRSFQTTTASPTPSPSQSQSQHSAQNPVRLRQQQQQQQQQQTQPQLAPSESPLLQYNALIAMLKSQANQAKPARTSTITNNNASTTIVKAATPRPNRLFSVYPLTTNAPSPQQHQQQQQQQVQSDANRTPSRVPSSIVLHHDINGRMQACQMIDVDSISLGSLSESPPSEFKFSENEDEDESESDARRQRELDEQLNSTEMLVDHQHQRQYRQERTVSRLLSNGSKKQQQQRDESAQVPSLPQTPTSTTTTPTQQPVKKSLSAIASESFETQHDKEAKDSSVLEENSTSHDLNTTTHERRRHFQHILSKDAKCKPNISTKKNSKLYIFRFDLFIFYIFENSEQIERDSRGHKETRAEVQAHSSRDEASQPTFARVHVQLVGRVQFHTFRIGGTSTPSCNVVEWRRRRRRHAEESRRVPSRVPRHHRAPRQSLVRLSQAQSAPHSARPAAAAAAATLAARLVAKHNAREHADQPGARLPHSAANAARVVHQDQQQHEQPDAQ